MYKSIELYRKNYQTLNEKTHREMVAKAIRTMSLGDKLRSVHISPVTIEKCEGYSMEETHSSDRCIRLLFKNAYTARQTKAMNAEIRQLASERLTWSLDTIESADRQAFIDCLTALSKVI